MKSLQGSKTSNSGGGTAVCPFAQMASSSFQKDPQSAAAATALQEEDENHNQQHHHEHNHQPGACDSSSTSSWEPDSSSQYEEDLAMMTQKCPIFQQQQNNNNNSHEESSSPRSITFSCPFKDQQLAATAAQDNDDAVGGAMRETLLKIPPSHYDMGEFVRVMEGFHHRVAIAAAANANSAGNTSTDKQMQMLPTKCPVPMEIKGKISFRQAMESRSMAAIMARLAKAEEHYQQQQQQQKQHLQQQQPSSEQQQQQQQQRERADSDLTAFSTEGTTAAAREATLHEQAVAAAVAAAPSLVDEAPLHSVDPHVVAATPGTTTTTASSTTTTSPITTTPTSLSHELKTGTAISHQAAENVHFVRNFIRGKIDRHLYGQLVSSLYHVYTALELELDIHAPQHFASCHFPVELKRVAALQQDVDFWHGSSASTATTSATNATTVAAPEMSPATRDYVERIHDIAKTNPLLLLAHSYTRYLGDLSGGKILSRVARRALNLSKPKNDNDTNNNNNTPVDGLHFYHFDKIESDKKFKDKYRQSLDDLNHLTPSEISQLVAEANVAFLLNMRVFEELDVAANLPGATVRPLQEALDYAATAAAATSTTDHPEEEQECPFLKRQPKQTQATSTTTSTSTAHGKGGGRCPWPFVVFHDPIQFVCDWQTMVLVIFIGLLFMIWQKAAATTST